MKQQFIQTFYFFKKSHRYFRDILILHGLMLFVLMPFLKKTAQFILKHGDISYLSFDNLGEILFQHGGIFVSLLLLGIAMLCALYFEFTFLILSLSCIIEEKVTTVSQLFFASLKKMKRTNFSKLLFFFAYFLLILPLSGLGFHSELIARIKIPAFVVDFIFQQRRLVVSSFLALYIAALYLALRWFYVLPFLVLQELSVREAVKKSWRFTQRKFHTLLGEIGLLYFSVLLVVSFCFLLLVGFQKMIDLNFPTISGKVAAVSLTLLEGLSIGQSVMLSALMIYLMVLHLKQEKEISLKNLQKKWWPFFEGKSLIILRNIVFIGGLITLFVLSSLGNYIALKDWSFTPPLIISHRGVDDSNGPNGVQNSLAALENTAKEQPDFVEMDIFQTKDQQFAVVHDRNLKKLTGKNVNIEDLTLKEATALTVRENGQTADLVSFDTYLSLAEKIQQPLLVEIKTTPKDSPKLVRDFIARYKERLLKNGAWVQSLTYQISEELKQAAPELQVGYILPFNIIGPPLSSADFFVMEHTTLNESFVDVATEQGKKVIAWTVNDPQTMERMVFYGAKGVVTDKVATLQKAANNQPENPTYSDKLLYFWIGLG